MGLLTSDEREKLRDLLLKLPNIKTGRATRNTLILDDFQEHVESSDIAHTHIDNIIATVDGDGAQRADGSWPIIRLIETAIHFDAGSQTAEDLKELLATVQERAADLETPPDRPPEPPNSPPARTPSNVQRLVDEAIGQLRSIQSVLAIRDVDKIRLRHVRCDATLLQKALTEIENINPSADRIQWRNDALTFVREAGKYHSKCCDAIAQSRGWPSGATEYRKCLETARGACENALKHSSDLSAHLVSQASTFPPRKPEP